MKTPAMKSLCPPQLLLWTTISAIQFLSYDVGVSAYQIKHIPSMFDYIMQMLQKKRGGEPCLQK
jgi:hypothetical protein